eukprot:UN22310
MWISNDWFINFSKEIHRFAFNFNWVISIIYFPVI